MTATSRQFSRRVFGAIDEPLRSRSSTQRKPWISSFTSIASPKAASAACATEKLTSLTGGSNTNQQVILGGRRQPFAIDRKCLNSSALRRRSADAKRSAERHHRTEFGVGNLALEGGHVIDKNFARFAQGVDVPLTSASIQIAARQCSANAALNLRHRSS